MLLFGGQSMKLPLDSGQSNKAYPSVVVGCSYPSTVVNAVNQSPLAGRLLMVSTSIYS